MFIIEWEGFHKELLPVKEKWHSIGKVLKLSPERLHQFKDVTDPLMEVIVHWVKGVGDTPPSWDTIVGTLRDPSVNEMEVADKIDRIYCDHVQEEKGKKTKEAQACSGMQQQYVGASISNDPCTPVLHPRPDILTFERYLISLTTKRFSF